MRIKTKTSAIKKLLIYARDNLTDASPTFNYFTPTGMNDLWIPRDNKFAVVIKSYAAAATFMDRSQEPFFRITRIGPYQSISSLIEFLRNQIGNNTTAEIDALLLGLTLGRFK